MKKKTMPSIGIIMLELYLFLTIISDSLPWYGHVFILGMVIFSCFYVDGRIDIGVICLAMHIFITFMYCLRYNTSLNDTIVRSCSLLAIGILIFRYQYISKITRAAMIWIALICNIITQIITIYYAIQNPEIVRNIMHGEALGKGIASFTHVYLYIVFAVILYFAVLRSKGKRKIFCIILLALDIITILVSAFLIASILLVAMFLIALFKCGLNLKMKICASIFLVAIFIVGISNFESIFEFLLNIEELSISVKVRLSEIYEYIATGDLSVGDLGARANAYISSLQTFFFNMPFGALLPINAEFTSIGGHSNILDLMGYYGLLSVFYFAFLIKSYKIGLRSIDGYRKDMYSMIWIVFIAIAMMNPADETHYLFTICILYPCFNEYLIETRGDIKQY